MHSGQLLKPGGSFWVFRMSNEFAGQYRQSEHQCQIPLRSDRNSIAMKDDIYAFIFSQKGLMAGLGIQGNKITKINPK